MIDDDYNQFKSKRSGMQYLIDDYEAYVQEQQARLVKEESYFQKFSYQPEVARDI